MNYYAVVTFIYGGYLPFWIGWPIKTLNRNIFRSIYKKFYRKKFVIKNKLSILYRRVKSMHYPESPKVKLNWCSRKICSGIDSANSMYDPESRKVNVMEHHAVKYMSLHSWNSTRSTRNQTYKEIWCNSSLNSACCFSNLH